MRREEMMHGLSVKLEKQLLLPKLLSGEIRVKEAEKLMEVPESGDCL